MRKISLLQRVMALFLCLALVASLAPMTARAATPVAQAIADNTVTDPSTADDWEHMMGTDTDGNRYAGRVWADRSVYQNGDTVVLNSRGETNSSFTVSLEEDEVFQVMFSVLGSTMTTTETVSSTGPMDVVLVLDISPSMTEKVSDGASRLQTTIAAANTLIDNLLKLDDMRLGIVTYSPSSEVLLPLAAYNDGIVLSADDTNCVITVKNSSGQQLKVGRGNGSGGTNLQSGIDTGMKMLAEASSPKDRVPVLIPLTDGQANYAVTSNFYNISAGSREYDEDGSSGVVLSTLLNAAYNKVLVEKHYGKAPKVYGVTVDLKNNAFANALMDPANSFNSSNSSSAVKEAYEEFENWAEGDTVTIRKGSWLTGYTTWTFNHNFPASPAVTTAEVAENINYVDKHYDVSSDELNLVFTQIYKELSSAAFNPITSSTSSVGGTGVDDTPLIYADYIGQYMEIKEIEAVTLFGASYGVTKHADGSYTVTQATGTNPTTNESWNTADDIRIYVTEQADGTQKLEIHINQEILPIILEKVDAETVGNVTTSTIIELTQDPLRVFYTIGVDESVLLPNGKIDVSKLQGYEYIDDANGTVTFYASQFGKENPADGAGVVYKGDSHVGFQPSDENRYYYHQENQGIFIGITDRNGQSVSIPENNEYGIVWDEDAYTLDWMSYDEYLTMRDGMTVYTYVSYYHPTPSTTDAANAAEKVTYLVYTDWMYLKESVAFYDNNTGTYLNDGKVASQAEVEAYLQANPNADIYAVLGVGSRRTSRLHNMMHEKLSNDTGTAVESYTPEYLENKQDHHGNDVVIWLGNNGKLTVEVETGIALTKQVTESIGSADDTYALTVTVPAGVAAEPVVLDAHGNAVAFTYTGNVLTVNVKANETVYISGIPGGTVCTIDEIISGDYYVDSKTDSVTVPLVSQAISSGVQFVPATVTNAPNKYGDLTVIKEIDHDFDSLPTAMANKVFTFKVELDPYTAGDQYTVDKLNAPGFAGDTVTVGADGSFTVELKDNESVTILGIPAGTGYTVTELVNVPGYSPVQRALSGTIQPDGDHDALFVNVYSNSPITPEITVTGTKTLLDVNGTYTDNEDFIFQLHQYDPGTGTYSLLAETTAKAGERYAFRLVDALNQPLGIGDHFFRVTEVSGRTEGMSYDSSRGLFAVHVTDTDADGTLEYTVENVGNTTVSGDTVTKDFVNTYDVARTHADIKIVKVIGQNDTGVNIPLNLFHFQLKDLTFSDSAPPLTVTTDAAGNAVIRLTELRPGQYTYTLTEVDDGMPGMVYDTTPRTVIVTVEEVGGVLSASVQIDGVDTDTANFRNDYILNSTSHTISGSKLLQGRAPVNDEFSFSLYETDATFVLAPGTAPKQTVENVGDSFSFEAITYTRVGTYYYSVKEENTSVPGVTYDTTHYHVIVTVSAAGEDLVVSDVQIHKIGHNEDTSGNIVFVNGYEVTPTQYTLSGVKVLHGRAPRAHEFSFGLYEDNVLLQTVTNKADGSFSFESITYTEAGEYTYTIKEMEGNVPGVTYDGVNAPITVTVTVTDQGGYLSASADVENEDITFVNTYTPANAKVVFNGEKYLHGKILEDNAFTFQLYVTDHTFEITDSAVQLIDEEQNVDGKFQFSGEFSNPGTYYFAIVEDTSDPVEGIVYDRTHHKFMVHVTDNGVGDLLATVTNVTTGESTVADVLATADVSFTNATDDQAVEKTVQFADATTNIDGLKVEAGDVLTYYIVYRNYTGHDVEVEIEDTIPAHTAYVEGSASHGATFAGQHLNWILNVSRGGSVTVSFQVVVQELDADDAITNTAIIRDGENSYTTNEVSNPVDAPEPTVPPTEPTEPTVAPTRPTVAPTAPTEAPTEPTDAPAEPPTEAPTQPGEPSEPGEPDAPPIVPDLPQTGDSLNLQLWFAVLFVCSGGMVITAVLGRKEKKRQPVR
ncbi:MAG: DUF11 domain-containing protein [Oscillospiraceae bacterium]|nr:DUF11 domain-containing protein [Oscillospiraceae bacterium]